MQSVSQVLQHGRTELAKVIVGQQELIDQTLLTLLCGGHALLEGVPGIAKTLVIKAFARLFERRCGPGRGRRRRRLRQR